MAGKVAGVKTVEFAGLLEDGKVLSCFEASLDASGDPDFLASVEQRHLSNFFQVQTHGVVCAPTVATARARRTDPPGRLFNIVADRGGKRSGTSNSLGVDRYVVARISRRSCSVGSVRYRYLSRDRRIMLFVEHDTRCGTRITQRTDQRRIKLDVFQCMHQGIERKMPGGTCRIEQLAKFLRCGAKKRNGGCDVGHPSLPSACWISHGSNCAMAASREVRSESCSVWFLSHAIAVA